MGGRVLGAGSVGWLVAHDPGTGWVVGWWAEDILLVRVRLGILPLFLTLSEPWAALKEHTPKGG